jgi:hypothetical protein
MPLNRRLNFDQQRPQVIKRVSQIVIGVGFLLSAVLSPRHGLIARCYRPPHHHREETAAVCEVPEK